MKSKSLVEPIKLSLRNFFVVLMSLMILSCAGESYDDSYSSGSSSGGYYQQRQQPAYRPQPAPYYGQQQYSAPYAPPASRFYSNPYAIPPYGNYQGGSYYDDDQYYVPPNGYRNVEKQQLAPDISSPIPY